MMLAQSVKTIWFHLIYSINRYSSCELCKNGKVEFFVNNFNSIESSFLSLEADTRVSLNRQYLFYRSFHLLELHWIAYFHHYQSLFFSRYVFFRSFFDKPIKCILEQYKQPKLNYIQFKIDKVGYVFLIVVVSMLSHADMGRNDHREGASHFIINISGFNNVCIMLLGNKLTHRKKIKEADPKIYIIENAFVFWFSTKASKMFFWLFGSYDKFVNLGSQ